MAKKSDLESSFDYYWQMLAPEYPTPIEEHRFHPPRRWRFDRAWLDAKVAVEIDGGTFKRGRHVRGMGYHNQLDKQNQAILDGWRILRYDTKHIHEDPQLMIDQIKVILDEPL